MRCSFALMVLVLAGTLGVPAGAATPEAQARIEEAAAAMARRDTAQAVTAYTEALRDGSLSNDRRAVVLNDRAVANVRLGQTRPALEDFNRAAQLFPEFAALYNNRGNLLLALNQPKEALKDFDRAIVLAPGYVAAYNNRAATHLKLANHREAIADFTRAIKLAPQSPAPLAGRGRVHLAEGRPHAAARDFTRAAAADARFAPAYRSRAEAKVEAGQLEDAIEDYSRAIVFDPGNFESFVLRGHAYLAFENAASAIKDFTRAIEIEPRSPVGYQSRGLAHGIAEATEDAFADLNKAIEIDPRSATAFAYRAYVYKLGGQIEVGSKDVETALKLDPGLPEAYWAKGELVEAAGQTEQAIDDLKRALAAKPSLRQARVALERLGASFESREDQELPGAGTDAWRVVTRGGRYFAVSADYPKLRVPLEMAGDGTPRLLGWELKKPPLKGIGVLRFHGGALVGAQGAEDIEMAAIVDLVAGTVVGIEPQRQGAKVATWTWDEGKLTIASLDGVTDEFVLRNVKPKEQPVASGAASPQRRYTSSEGPPGWAPWSDQNSGTSQGGNRRAPPRPAQKPKTLFDLLFKF